MQTRRNWIRSSIGLGGLLLAPEFALSKEEIRKFNPRHFLKQSNLALMKIPTVRQKKFKKL